ncbi:MAG: hypothetical protein FWH11_02955 [Micrococcales bacterium]|nr:hypothetical protein [Micrococcales bacterium]
MTTPWTLPGYQRLLKLQQRIYTFWSMQGEEDGLDRGAALWVIDTYHLGVVPEGLGVHVTWFGDPWEEPWDWTQQVLSEPSVASIITSLTFDGPDEGANGTRAWDFSELIDTDACFPLLLSLFVRPTAPDDHNSSMIARDVLKEGGQIARLVATAPRLTHLTVPNAPDASFFDVPLQRLTNLRVGGGYDTQRFVANLAGAKNLPSLKHLDFSECTELRSTWQADREPGCVTSFESYAELVSSPVGRRLRSLCLRNAGLSLAELESLQGLNPDLAIMVVQDGHGGYVSHFRKDVFPWRHLVQTDSGTDEMRYHASGGDAKKRT